MEDAMLKYGSIEIPDTERRECEVWTRAMGYYRPVGEFNIGKKAEHRDRKFFIMPKETPQ